jgi:methionyl aminopeptidase
MNFQLRGINHSNHIFNIPTIDGTEDCLESLRKAGIIHKMVRQDMKKMLKPGMKLYDLACFINDQIRYYTNYNNKSKQYNDGIAFPPILSKSNVIAHYSPSPNDNIILNYNDNLKIDFGVHVNGWIVDSAFTIYFNPEYYILNLATKDALDSALKIVGIDTIIDDVSDIISEVIESYEIVYNDDVHQLKVINNIGGHSIGQYNIHNGVIIPNKKKYNNKSQRFTKGIYAIEPFASILDSSTFNLYDCNNYRIKNEYKDECKDLYEKFNSMIFSDSHLAHYNINNIKYYTDLNMMAMYPTICGISDDMSCQYEHTIYINDDKKEIISKSYDY